MVTRSNQWHEPKYVMKIFKVTSMAETSQSMTNRTYWQKVFNIKQQKAQVRVFDCTNLFIINLTSC